MNIKEIVEKYLRENNCDGLCGDECECFLDDLMPCCDPPVECECGYKHAITEEMAALEDCELEVGDFYLSGKNHTTCECSHCQELRAKHEGASTNLITLEAVKDYLGIKTDENDCLLTGIIEGVSTAIEKYCNREFALRQRTEIYDGCSACAVVLKCRPVDTIESLRVDADKNFPDSSEVNESSYVYYPDAGILELIKGLFPDSKGSVRVVYTAGYTTPPPAVEQAAKILVAHLFNPFKDMPAYQFPKIYHVDFTGDEWPAAARGLLTEYREVDL